MSSTNSGFNEDEAERHPPRVQIEGLSKSFGHIQALNDISLKVSEAEVVGLVGENGAGKSTLLKILTGVLQPDDGDIQLDGESTNIADPLDAAQHGVSLVHQEQEVIPNLTGYENLLLGQEGENVTFGVLDRKGMIEEAKSIIDELGISLDLEHPVRNYSFQDRQMLDITKAFSSSLHSQHPLLLLDEPTAGLEESGRDYLFDKINELRRQACFIFVSHELDEVMEICDRIYILKDGNLIAERGVDETNESELEKLMVGRETQKGFYHIDKQMDPGDNETVMQAQKISVDGAFEDISFSLHKGEILGVVGVGGSGKERIGRTLAGDITLDAGSIYVNGREIRNGSVIDMIEAGVGYVPKDRQAEGLMLYRPVLDNISLTLVRDMNGDLPLLDINEEKETAEKMIHDLNIKTSGVHALANSLSGGNQQKVVLAKWLAAETPVLVLDNVTRGIDVGAKEEIYNLCRDLVNEGVSIVFIADELPEVIGMSNRIMVIKESRLQRIVQAPPEEKPNEEDIIGDMI